MTSPASLKDQVLRVGKILGAIAVAMAVLFLLNFAALKAEAKPLLQATRDGITITLTDDTCKLSAVSNMPYRATWREKNKVVEGCFSVVSQVGLVALYFDDKTVVLAAMAAFKPVEIL